MFQVNEKGELVDVQGLECYIPEVGHIWDYDKEKWVFDGVHKRRKTVPSECYWEEDDRFKDLPAWAAWVEESQDQKKKIEKKSGALAAELYEHPEFIRHHKELKYLPSYADLQKFIDDCWRWRLGGFWYDNNGVPTYITGVHWFYLSCYHIDTEKETGLPDYRYMDRLFFYGWEYVDEDPHSTGMNLVIKRRGGKTYISGCIALEKATRRKKFHVGIQSKTDGDAKEVFNKAIIEPFRRLPFFFKPVSDCPANNVPATALNFKSGKMNTSLEAELGSKIDFLPSSVKAYDGKKLGFYIDDECGKTEVVSVLRRWNIVKNCLLDNTRKVIGKSLHTTTVDEGAAGGDEFYKIWERSDQTKRNKLGRTNTGLFNFFVPAHYMGQADKYGMPDYEAEEQDILAVREAETDPRSKADLKRQFPLTVREAFSADSTSCIFSNIEGLVEQEDHLKTIPKRYVTGDFGWVDGIPDSKVEWMPTPTGKFMVAWMPEEKHQNLQRLMGGIRFPLNTDMGCGGCDPFDHKLYEDKDKDDGTKRMSKGALCFVKNPNVLAPSDLDEGPILLYMNRPADPDVFYEDGLMACVFFGFQILAEDNKPGFINHFEKRGYGGYLAWLPNRSKPGISNTAQSSGSGVNDQVAAMSNSYITHYITTCYFIDLVRQFMDFRVTDTTKFDAVMAFGFAKILQKTLGAGTKRAKSEKPPELRDTLPAFMLVTGGRSFMG